MADSHKQSHCAATQGFGGGASAPKPQFPDGAWECQGGNSGGADGGGAVGETYTAGYQSGIDAIVEAVWQKDDWSKQADTEADDNAQFCTVHFANMLAMLVDGQLDLGRDMRDTWFTPGVHLVFTSNIVAMMHSLLFSANRALMVRVMVATYVIFAVFYLLVYALSSKTYFNIVNATNE